MGVIYPTCTRLNSYSRAVRCAVISCVDARSGPSASDEIRYRSLKRSFAFYRVAFAQSRQKDLPGISQKWRWRQVRHLYMISAFIDLLQ